MSNYLDEALTTATQMEPIPGTVKNSAGGQSFVVDDWTRLERFLILGSEGGTYYAGQRELTRENAAVVERLVKKDGARLVRTIVQISDTGRAPKNDPAILALAMAAKLGDEDTRRAAYAALPRVCRIGTHLMHFVQYATQIGGWGRGLKRAVGQWYDAKTPADLSNQLIKYQARDGWSNRDLLRLSHPRPSTHEHRSLFRWATQGVDAVFVEKGMILPPNVEAFEEAKVTKDEVRLIKLITDYKLPRECVPTQWLTKAAVWEALLPHMGLTAVIRNLGQMTKVGLVAPLAEANKEIVRRITDPILLKKSRVHPIQLLAALTTYSTGHSTRGSSSWGVVQPIVDALDAGFYASFKNVTSTGKNTLLAIDVSGSMDDGSCAGIPGLSPRIGAAAMALVTAASEPNCHVVGFSATARGHGGRFGGGSPGLTDIAISPKMRLDAVVEVMKRIPMGGTDCSLPFTWATSQLKAGAKVESFAVYTDNETWAGEVHPKVALAHYRALSGIRAKSAVVAFTATPFTIADPTDPGMMDFVGFDAACPAIMADFFGGQTSKSDEEDE